MVKLNPTLTRRAVARMYILGLEEKDILKIFFLYDTEALVETLKHYKFITNEIPIEFFYNKLNTLQGWSGIRSRAQIFKKMLGETNEVHIL